jgi:hypothetical protein
MLLPASQRGGVGCVGSDDAELLEKLIDPRLVSAPTETALAPLRKLRRLTAPFLEDIY